jgi:hypothetical protein
MRKNLVAAVVVGSTVVAGLLFGVKTFVESRAAPNTAATATPVSHDAPLPEGTALRPPTEPRERPVGRLAFVVDSGSDSVYEFDLGRGRFLGPAPRIQYLGKVITLPGYPTLIGSQPPQRAVATHSALYVAEGASGLVVRIPIGPEGLGSPESIPLPTMDIPAYENVPSRPSSFGRTGEPLISDVAAFDDQTVVAVARANTGTVLYTVDFASHKVIATLAIPKAHVTAVVIHDGELYAASDGLIVTYGRDLKQRRQTNVDPYPNAITVVGGQLYVAFGSPVESIPVTAHVVKLDPATLHASTVQVANGTASGPIASGHGRVWWAIPGDGLHWFDPASPTRSGSLATKCKSVNGVAARDDAVLVTCVGPGTIIVVDPTGTAATRELPGGGFPDAVVFAP